MYKPPRALKADKSGCTYLFTIFKLKGLELVSEELYHLVAILQHYAGIFIFMK